MKDNTAMAYVNMYGVLSALEDLCAMDDAAKAILSEVKSPISMCLEVTGGPCCTFHFTKDSCRMTEGEKECMCRMRFASPEKFNDFIAKSKPGVPVKSPILLLKFLTGTFTKLTNRLTEVLRPDPEKLKDRAFFEESTTLTLYAVAGAISALANTDPIAKISAEYTVDGDVAMTVRDTVEVTIRIANHRFKTIKEPSIMPRARMEFADLDLVSDLFSGKASSLNEMCTGRLMLSGMISMIDNINRILDRVSVYLA